jgi:hypothetical protein
MPADSTGVASMVSQNGFQSLDGDPAPIFFDKKP